MPTDSHRWRPAVVPVLQCSECGEIDAGDSLYCGSCGAILDAPVAVNGGDSSTARRELRWETDVPLATDRFLLYDTAKVLVFSALAIIGVGSLVALLLSGADAPLHEWLMALKIVLLVFLGIGAGLLLVMLTFFGNRFPVRITVEPRGVRWEALSRRGKWANRTAMVAGLLAGKPGLMGAGILAETRRTEGMRWSDIQRVRCHPDLCVISLMNGWRVVLRLHCPPTLYREVCRTIRSVAPHAQMEGDPVCQIGGDRI